MSKPNTPHRAAVITADTVHYGNGGIIAARGLADDLPRLLAGTIDRFADHSTIVITTLRAASWTAQLAAIRGAGWHVADPDGISAWALFHRDGGRRTVAVGWRPYMRAGVHFGVLFGADTDPGTLALALDRFHSLTGMSWRGTPATSSLAGIRLSWPNPAQQPFWNDSKKGPGRGVGVLHWSRELTAREREWGYLHTFDANAAYLGAAINAELAWSELSHTGPIPFSKHTPGYWLIGEPTDVFWPSDGRPPLYDDRQVQPVTTPYGRTLAIWATTPMVELLAELGGQVAVLDSWTGASRGRTGYRAGMRVLRPWAETIRDARSQLAAFPGPLRDILTAAVKRSYKDAIGGMQRPGMRIHRPDWAHTVIDLWRATLIRRMIKVHATQGVWPVSVATDSLAYADCRPMPVPRGKERPWDTLTDALNVTACGISGCDCAGDFYGRSALGSYKHDTTGTVDDWDQAHPPPKPARATPRIPRPRRTKVGASS